jgi:hypothetical protein
MLPHFHHLLCPTETWGFVGNTKRGILKAWGVRYLEEAAQERSTMPARERVALDRAAAKAECLAS